MDAVTLGGLILAVVGIAFAFERPRKWFVGLFSKRPDISQTMSIQTIFHAHNDGKPLGALGTNKTEKKYFLRWTITNNTDNPLQFERGIAMRQAELGSPAILLTRPEQVAETTIAGGHTLELLSVELSNANIEDLRHWIRECQAFGLNLTDGRQFWVASPDFVTLGTTLQNIAVERGLPEQVPEGQAVYVKIERNV